MSGKRARKMGAALPPEKDQVLAIIGDGREKLDEVKHACVETGVCRDLGRASAVIEILRRHGLVQVFEVLYEKYVTAGTELGTPWGAMKAKVQAEGEIIYNEKIDSFELAAVLRLLKQGDVIVVVKATS